MKSLELIEAFARSLELTDISPTENGEYIFVFDDTLEIRLLPETTESIVIYGMLGSLPEDFGSRSQLLRRLLSANISSKVLAEDCVLCLKPEKDEEIVLYRRLDTAGTSADRFSKLISAYLNCLEFWKGSLCGSYSTQEPSPFFLLP